MSRCHAKTGLNICVIVIPKEGFAGTSTTKPSFGMTMTKILRWHFMVKIAWYSFLTAALAPRLFIPLTPKSAWKVLICSLVKGPHYC